MSLPSVFPPPSGPAGADEATARLLAAEASRAHGSRLRLVRPLAGGFQSGVWLVREDTGAGPGSGGEDAGLAVLKWIPGRVPPEPVLRRAATVERARAAGYRTPRRVSSGVSEDGVAYQVQEFVRGTRATRLTADTARRLVPLLESQRGLDIDPGHCWSRYADGRAGPGGAGVRHAVAGSGPRGRAFVAALDALVAASGEDRLPSGDLVHGDFRLGNIVFPPGDGPVALDVDAMGSGTRAYDYATLLTEDEVEPGGWQVVRAAGERVAGAAALARCFASAALDLADFVRLRVPERLPALIGPLTERAVALAPR